jgi:hypothetical protein
MALTCIVFAGPSLPRESVPAVPHLRFAPPARQGDILRAAQDEAVGAICLIDGVFDAEPSAWHKEIIQALAGDLAVVGAASMGALRAVELSAFGMVGVGAIFRGYRDGVFLDDADVACLHGPDAVAFRPLTVPLVNVHFTVRHAVRRRLLDAPSGAAALSRARAIYFKQRSEGALRSCLSDIAMKDGGALGDWIVANLVDQKRIDAAAAIAQCGDLSSRDGSRRNAAALRRSRFWS